MNIAEKLTAIAENEQKVYEAGKKAEYDEFWDVVQQNGNRTDYYFGFGGSGWSEKNFKPKYQLNNLTSAEQMFFKSTNLTIDLAKKLDELGIKFNTSKATRVHYIFSHSGVTRVPTLDTSSAANIPRLFTNAYYLETIDKLILKDDGSQGTEKPFEGCHSLKNITIEGVIGTNGWNFQWSPLTHDSIISILIALQDKSHETVGGVWTLTLGTNNLSKISDAEKAIARDKGWNLG